jgi:hypothetical protein
MSANTPTTTEKTTTTTTTTTTAAPARRPTRTVGADPPSCPVAAGRWSV